MKMGGGPGGGGHEVGPHRAPADFQNSVLVETGVLFSGKRGLRFWILIRSHFGVVFWAVLGLFLGSFLGSVLEVCCFRCCLLFVSFVCLLFGCSGEPCGSRVHFRHPFVFPFGLFWFVVRVIVGSL